jgi:ABC-type nickel/cobalt efflux system permease component RcnA
MTSSVKYRLSQGLVAITIPVAAYMFMHMLPAGLAGNVSEAKRWFAGAIIVIILGIAAYLSMTYYRTRLSSSETSTQAMDVLSAAAADADRQKRLNRKKDSNQSSDHQSPKRLV